MEVPQAEEEKTMLKRSRFVLLALSILAPSLAAPQAAQKQKTKAVSDRKSLSPGSMSGPILGLVFDPIHGGLRRVLGIPGASTLGDILEVGIPISQAWISPRQDCVVAEIRDSREIVLLDPSRDPLAVSSVGIAKPGPDHVVFSPTGASVVLFHRATHSIQLITGLPSASSLVAEIDISSLPESLNAMAVSDDAGAVVLGVFEGEAGAIYVINESREVGPVSVIGQASAISFLTNTRDALITDRRNNELLLIRDVTGMALKLTLAGERDGILGPVAVQVSDDNKRILVANSESSTISVLHLDNGVIQQVSCGKTPSGLYRLGSPSVFRLTDFSEQPLLLLEAGAEEPQALFVPRLSAR
jgi:YVTN family beta-propeller protein